MAPELLSDWLRAQRLEGFAVFARVAHLTGYSLLQPFRDHP
jgi:hypothetical protein